jgi:hypothetical protein
MSGEAEDELTPEEREQDAKDAAWFGRVVVLPIRRDIVRALLAGNDTGCFSTEQYQTAYLKHTREKLNFTSLPYLEDWGAKHLQSTGLVHEVAPGVWVAICHAAEGV